MLHRWATITASPTTRASLVVLGICATVAAAAAATRSVHRQQAPFAIRVSPGVRTVTLGQTGRFTLTIVRASTLASRGEERPTAGTHRRFDRPVWLGVVRPVPRGIAVWLSPNPVLRSSSAVVLRLSPRLAPGSYRVGISARAGGHLARAWLRVVAFQPISRSFAIGGSVRGEMAPGQSIPVAVTLANPYRLAISIAALSVRISGITAPNADAEHPCTTDDFSLSAFSGHYGFTLAPRSQNSLGELGFPLSQWPQLQMIDRPVNQDGCMGASVVLSYTDTAIAGR